MGMLFIGAFPLNLEAIGVLGVDRRYMSGGHVLLI